MNISLVPNQKLQTIHCSQGDVGRTWEFTLSADEDITPIGSASFVCRNLEIPMTRNGNTLSCSSTSELTAQSGLFDAKIKLVNGDEVIHSSLFQLHIEVKP